MKRSTSRILASVALVAVGFAAARLVPPRAAAQPATETALRSGVVRTEDAAPTRGEWGEWRRFFRGDTHGTKDMVVLAVTLKPGQAPHPPHRHAEEEFMILAEGGGTWTLGGKEIAAKKGDVVYAAPWTMHGLKNTGDGPLTYYMVKWSGKGVPPQETPAAEAKGEADKPAGAVDDAVRKKADQKAAKIVESLKLADAGKAAKVKAIASDWLAVMTTWHKGHDAELNRLWGEWNKARSVVPKDEFPGEVIAHQIDAVYASLRPAYEEYMKRLSAELTVGQVDAIKESWSSSPGMMRTYNAYLEIVPDLTAKDKEVIKARMLVAREAAMLTDADKEIVAIYKRHKVKVEQYVGTLEWAKLHKAFAERGKSQADIKK